MGVGVGVGVGAGVGVGVQTVFPVESVVQFCGGVGVGVGDWGGVGVGVQVPVISQPAGCVAVDGRGRRMRTSCAEAAVVSSATASAAVEMCPAIPILVMWYPRALVPMG